MNELIMLPTTSRRSLNLGEFAEEATIVIDEPTRAAVSFLEANTEAITIEELANKCVVPTWANQELTIAHQDFINCVHEAAQDFYHGEVVNAPDIRCSHIVRGRVPNALGKKASELLECEKTQFYQRLAFAFTIPTIYETVRGEKLELFHSFNPAKDIHLLQALSNTYLTETQFAQVVGRMRMFQALPSAQQKRMPQLLITDSQINSVCRDFYRSEHFGMKDNAISLFDFHNLLTEANKMSYCDTYLHRAVNATEVSVGLNNVMQGIDDRYAWFLS